MEAANARDDAEQPNGFKWQALGANLQAAHEVAAEQARELARGLAAHALIYERDATPAELEDRFDVILESVWPKGRALQGYALQSSLGAHAIAKVAFDLVPAGRIGLRHEPLRRQGLIAALVEHGVDEFTAASVLGDWQDVREGFRGDPEGLSASTVAGLAERTLTRGERGQALDQVAVSPRCLNRLASTLGLLAAVRVLLPLVPPGALGADVLVAIVGLALGRPDRVVQLFEGRTQTLRMRTFMELAQAQWSLLRAEAPVLDDDPLAFGPPMQEGLRPALERSDTEVLADAFEVPEDRSTFDDDEHDDEHEQDDDDEHDDDDDDVLEIVEQRPDPAAEPAAARTFGPGLRPARWDPEAGTPMSEAELAEFATSLKEHRTWAARAGGLLGIRAHPASPTVPRRPVPPHERVLAALQARLAGPTGDEELTERIAIDPVLHGHGIEVEDLPFDPLFVPVRGALRAVVRAAEGEAPTLKSIAAAGDMDWVLARARALALLVQGDLRGAEAAVRGFPDASAPEGRWAKDRAVRFEGRLAEPLPIADARPVAAAMITDLIQQLARTLAGTLAEGSTTLGARGDG